MRVVLSAAVLSVMLAGCAQQLPPLNFSVPNTGLSERPLDAEVRSLTVTIGRPDEQVGPIDWALIDVTGGGTITAMWQTAMQEALDRTLIFRDGGTKKVSIAVKILKLDSPEVGFDMTTDAVVRYEVIDRTNGDIIFTQDIVASGTTPLGHAFLDIVRIRESVNRAVQNNISLFLQAAETIDLGVRCSPRVRRNETAIPYDRRGRALHVTGGVHAGHITRQLLSGRGRTGQSGR